MGSIDSIEQEISWIIINRQLLGEHSVAES
jgi:hypothetical protein